VQLAVAHLSSSDSWREDVHTAVRQQLRHGIRHAAGLSNADLFEMTEILFDALVVACHETCNDVAASGGADLVALAAAGHLAAMAARNGALLATTNALADAHLLAERLRGQVVAVHAGLRVPHTGMSRAVPWPQLYVSPSLSGDDGTGWCPSLDVLTGPGHRVVVLGDPGAGKSTFVTHLAFQIGSDPTRTQVPFLVVLRDHAALLRVGERRLGEYLAAVAANPYNVQMSAETIDYLLLNGRAIVIFDGLDELIDVSLRRRVVDLVEGFVSLYPLVPVVVTSRRVGYAEAPLNRSLFRLCCMEPFTSEQVTEYATHWFALDDSAPSSERDRLRRAFLRESASIKDLRCNPLLLALLCSMYATERYLPRNRAEVYERCALTVFERWDKMRGIQMPLRFHGHVRGAVQHLAWSMFAVHRGGHLARGKVLRLLNGYLSTKGYDDDAAAAMSEDFLEFCAGRAWVLTEVGATECEPIYGFAHRTFLEYFTAEYLVRRHASPDAVWRVLATKVGDSEWEVVAQLALQLLDRNVDDGADALLGLLLEDAQGPPAPISRGRIDPGEQSAPERQPLTLGFAARAATHLAHAPGPLTRLMRAALDCALSVGREDRFRYWLDDATALRVNSADDPLLILMHDSPDVQVPVLQRALAEELSRRAVAGHDMALYMISRLVPGQRTRSQRRPAWERTAQELYDSHHAQIEAWRRRFPWGWTDQWPTDADSVSAGLDRFGPGPFYMSQLLLANVAYPPAIEILAEYKPSMAVFRRPADELCSKLLTARRPWMAAQHWGAQLALASQTGGRLPAYERLRQLVWPSRGEALATFITLSLPYLESNQEGDDLAGGLPVNILAETRANPNQYNREVLDTYLPRFALPSAVEAFLRRWVNGDFSVIG
jgi:hypothetical protein